MVVEGELDHFLFALCYIPVCEVCVCVCVREVVLMAFLSGVIIRQHGRCRGPLRKRYQRHVCAVAAGVTEESIESRLVEDTPITKELNVSPMKKVDREYYIAQATDSVAAAVQDVRNGQKGGSLMNVTMLIPDLNPALDVYDRRFLVKVVWEIVTEMVVHRGMTVKVMTQSATKFGGLPISVAGLMRSFESDKARSAEGWGGAMERVRTSDIDAAAVEEDDDLFLIMSATNSTSSPVIEVKTLSFFPMCIHKSRSFLSPSSSFLFSSSVGLHGIGKSGRISSDSHHQWQTG